MEKRFKGIIGQELLKRINKAEESGDWDLVIELLAMAQIEAMKNYKSRLIFELKDQEK